MRVLIIGCGYVGTTLGRLLVRQGHEVEGVRRSSGDLAELESIGIRPAVWDVTEPAGFPSLDKRWDWVVNALSSRGGGVAGYEQLYLRGTRHLLEWLTPKPPERYVHISSTSVYGQTDGSLVTEASPAEPTNGTSQVLVAVEQQLLRAGTSHRWPGIILRSAGIYGRGRGHLFHQFLAGEARLTGDGSRWLNMAHVEDVAGAAFAALERGKPGDILNVSDNEPVTELDFFRWLSARLRRPLPPPAVEEKARKRGATNKRVSNAKLRAELGYEPQFPSFREGYEQEIRRLEQAANQEPNPHG